MRVLVVEDNPKMADAVRVGLEADGYAVDMCHTGFEGEDLAAGGEYDLIVLDLMLPDRDGVEVCRNLRRREVATPVLMLTALSSTKSKVDGLDAGADDYLTKPFEFDELLARVRAMLRRGSAQEGDRLKVADVELDLRRRKANRAGDEIHLSAREFALLEFLMRNPDRVLSRTVICEKVWDMNYEPTSNVVDVYISALRRKMDRGYDSLLIHTVIGSGYRFGLEESNSRSAG